MKIRTNVLWYIVVVAIWSRNGSTEMNALDACIAAYVEYMGVTPTDQALTKVKSIAIRNGRPNCDDCGIRFSCADDAELDHRQGIGGQLRAENLKSRHEARMIVDGTHPDPTSVVYLCSNCNKLKRSMTEAEWLASPQLAASKRRAERLNG